MITAMRLEPFARPTARDAAGTPTRAASSVYEIVSPYGIRCSSRQTRSWNALPGASIGTSNMVRRPAK
jgi:hypothetical protein